MIIAKEKYKDGYIVYIDESKIEAWALDRLKKLYSALDAPTVDLSFELDRLRCLPTVYPLRAGKG